MCRLHVSGGFGRPLELEQTQARASQGILHQNYPGGMIGVRVTTGQRVSGHATLGANGSQGILGHAALELPCQYS